MTSEASYLHRPPVRPDDRPRSGVSRSGSNAVSPFRRFVRPLGREAMTTQPMVRNSPYIPAWYQHGMSWYVMEPWKRVGGFRGSPLNIYTYTSTHWSWVVDMDTPT